MWTQPNLTSPSVVAEDETYDYFSSFPEEKRQKNAITHFGERSPLGLIFLRPWRRNFYRKRKSKGSKSVAFSFAYKTIRRGLILFHKAQACRIVNGADSDAERMTAVVSEHFSNFLVRELRWTFMHIIIIFSRIEDKYMSLNKGQVEEITVRALSWKRK